MSLFHCRKISDHKYWWSSKTISVLSKSNLKPGGFFVKILTKVAWKLEKLKCQNFKKCMFGDPVIVNTAFSWLSLLKLCSSIKTNVWYLRSLEKLAIKMWFPFNFAKNLKDRHFVVGGSKNLKLSTNTCFGVSFQKKFIAKFSAIFICLLSRWPKQ